MSRLTKLYQTMTNLKELGLSVNEELVEEANALEEEIIKKEILPILTESIAPALKQVQRELVLVVDYVPGMPISVHLSRKRNITAAITDAKEILPDPVVTHGTRVVRQNNIQRKPATDFSVTFPDGTVVAETTAVKTFVKVVKRIGVERVRQVVEAKNLKFCKVPVISNRRDAKYGRSQHELGGGWLLITHSNNNMKKQFLDRVSEALKLGLKVEVKD